MATDNTARERTLILGSNDRVVVTGAGGFIGSAIVRALLGRDVHAVAITQAAASTQALDDLPVEKIDVDYDEQDSLTRAIEGARVVIHVPPDYRARAHDPRSYQDLNVEDTRRVLAAVRATECDRMIYTSSVGTLGHPSTDNPADEESVPHIDELVGLYRQSKYVAEHEVLRAAAEGLPITLVAPTTSVGPFDFAPTPSGRIILDYLNGRPANWFDTALNIVDVDDLAEGYLLAVERGAVGRSYIIGGENIEYRTLFDLLEECTGLQTRGFRVPRWAALVAASFSEFVEGRILRREPSVPIEGVRLASTPLVFSDLRAREELGYTSRSALQTVYQAARWFAEAGYVSQRQLDSIVWVDDVATQASL